MKYLIKYFFQGILFLVPISITFYVIFFIVSALDTIIPFDFPGLGILTMLGIIVAIGFLSDTILFEKIFKLFEELIFRIPFAKIIYTSLKDLINAFVGNKKKFEYPVLVIMNKSAGIKKMGFIAQKDLSFLGMEDEVAVYFPHSYNFSGNLFVIPRENVIELKDVSATQAMKFILSGGMAGIEE